MGFVPWEVRDKLRECIETGKPYIFIWEDDLPEDLTDAAIDRLILRRYARRGGLIFINVAYENIGAVDRKNDSVCLTNVEIFVPPHELRYLLNYKDTIDHLWVKNSWIEAEIINRPKVYPSLLIPARAYEYKSGGRYLKYGVEQIEEDDLPYYLYYRRYNLNYKDK